jgi:hypothetical protein
MAAFSAGHEWVRVPCQRREIGRSWYRFPAATAYASERSQDGDASVGVPLLATCQTDRPFEEVAADFIYP